MLVLASASPRRHELLSALNVPFVVETAGTDEQVKPDESPETYVARVAQEKAAAVLARRPGDTILAADTSVAIDGQILGKPASFEEARHMWQQLSGRRHTVYSAIVLMDSHRTLWRVVATSVEFRALAPDDMEWYWHTREPQDKAGGYGIQGLGGRFVSSIQGSYSNVVGLPLVETEQLLQTFGVLPAR